MELLELSIANPMQLFNSMDPAPFHERDLDLAIGRVERNDRCTERKQHPEDAAGGVEVESANPALDAAKLLTDFLARAYRRPVPAAEVQRFLPVVRGGKLAGAITRTDYLRALRAEVARSAPAGASRPSAPPPGLQSAYCNAARPCLHPGPVPRRRHRGLPHPGQLGG